ncbi:MAG: DNA polymerase III subunit gamma/tau [Clostridia bacterium]
MSYQALYRTYRPKSFDEMVGQEHITKTLANQVKTGDIGHAYLFVGSRGTGKTSSAKIFARAINCLSPVNGSPCGKCEVCQSFDSANNIDILEIDAASNNGVDEARAIREKVKYPPINGKYKVFIIDEVHMLTDSAFNALLKTLEEPPPFVVFILATTEVHKIPATILSRCMRFDFKLVPATVLANHLENIFSKASILSTKDATMAIALAGEGSVRDALSIADCVSASSNKNITLEDVQRVIGSNDIESVLALTEAILSGQVGLGLEKVSSLASQGKNLSVVVKELCAHFRNLLVCQSCSNPEKIILVPNETMSKLTEQSKKISKENLILLLQTFGSIEMQMRSALSPEVLLETTVVAAAQFISQGENFLSKKNG